MSGAIFWAAVVLCLLVSQSTALAPVAELESMIHYIHNRQPACGVSMPVYAWNATRLVARWIKQNVVQRRSRREDLDGNVRVWPSPAQRKRWTTELAFGKTAVLHDAAWSRFVLNKHDDWAVVAREKAPIDAFLAQCAPLVADLARSRLDRNEALVVRRRSDATANVDMPYALTLGAAARLSAACGADVERFFGEPVMHFVDSLAVEWRSDHHAGSGCEIVRVRDANLMDAKSNPRLFDLTYMQPAFLDGTAERREVCNDAFAVHIFNERFANDMVELGESHGNWTQEPTDSYPTEDIQLDEIKWEDQWESILERRIVPLMEELYEGTSWDMLFEPFLVRYIMTGQYELEPHQDTSKVTSVVTLSNQFEGGGVRFPRQNCTFISKTLGLTLFHPGLVTHQHTGLPITAGRRYIFVSFNQ